MSVVKRYSISIPESDSEAIAVMDFLATNYKLSSAIRRLVKENKAKLLEILPK